jgi:hypothetical protein
MSVFQYCGACGMMKTCGRLQSCQLEAKEKAQMYSSMTTVIQNMLTKEPNTRQVAAEFMRNFDLDYASFASLRDYEDCIRMVETFIKNR